jgi:hypothetical protein
MAPNRHKLTLLERARQKCRDYDGKSMWDWYKYDLTRWEDIGEEEYVKEASLEDPIVLECWKYENEDITSGFTIPEDEVKYIKEDDIPAWLERSPPGERLPCAGLRLIHKFQHPEVLDGPSNQQMFATINDKFGLPDVLWRHTATLPGACGKFMSTDSRSGMLHQDLRLPC